MRVNDAAGYVVGMAPARRQDGADWHAAWVRSHIGASALLSQCCPECGSSEHGPVSVHSPEGQWWTTRSYADGLVVAALSSRGPIGVDATDCSSESLSAVASVALHPDEVGAYRDAQPEQLAWLWSAKEAVLKAVGVGLMMDPTRLAVANPGEPFSLVAWEGDLPRPNVDLLRVRLRERPRLVVAVAIVTPPV